MSSGRRARAFTLGRALECRQCGAKPVAPCKTRSGKEAREDHADRFYAGQRAIEREGDKAAKPGACHESEDSRDHCYHYKPGFFARPDDNLPYTVTCCDCGDGGEFSGFPRREHGPKARGKVVPRKAYRFGLGLKIVKGGKAK